MNGIRADPARTSALVVGVGAYRNQAWNVEGPAEAAREAYKYLLENRAIPDERIRRLISDPKGHCTEDPPTAEIVRATLKEVSKTEGELLIVFWSGHGAIDLERRRRLFLADAEFDDPRNLDLQHVLTRFASTWCTYFRRQLWIVDTCAVPMRYVFEFDHEASLTLPDGRNTNTAQALLFGSLLHETSRPGVFWRVLLAQLKESEAKDPPGDPPSRWPELGTLFAGLKAGFEKDGEDRSPCIELRNWDGSVKDANRAQIRTSMLLREEREEAATIVAEGRFEEAKVKPAYVAGLEVTEQAAQERSEAVTFADCLRHLSVLESPLPLLAMALGIARQLDVVPERKLREWCTRVATRLRVGHGRLQDLERQVIPPKVTEAALLIQIRNATPEGDEPTVLLTAWLWTRGGYENEPEYPREVDDRENALSLTELKIAIPALVQRVRARLPQPPAVVRLSVELMVPATLLSLDFDSWPIEKRGLRASLGTTYPVLLRSLERMEDPLYSDRWRPRWNRLRMDAGMKLKERMCWIEPGQMAPEELFRTLDGAGQEVCVGMVFAPDAEEPWVDGAVLAGIPAILWLRRQPDEPAAARAHLCTELGDSTIEGLPDWLVGARRRGQAGSEDHVLRHLAVLWDDAERGFPDQGPELRLG